jgi:hypothetical protein
MLFSIDQYVGRISRTRLMEIYFHCCVLCSTLKIFLQRELTRRVAVFEVNQAIMSRKYTLLEKSESELRKSHARLQSDHTEMLRTLKLRVLYLELWRRGGQSAIEEQQRLLDDMVPKGKEEKKKVGRVGTTRVT